jgi:hypothetical protein
MSSARCLCASARRLLLAPLLAPLRAAPCGSAQRSLYLPSSLPAAAAPAAGALRVALGGAQRAAAGGGRGLGGSGGPVRRESTRRKRIKAMTKHKYEKRQKKIRNLTALNQSKK